MKKKKIKNNETELLLVDFDIDENNNLSFNNDKFRYYKESYLIEIDFIALLKIVFKNKQTFDEYIKNESKLQLVENNKPIVDYLNDSINRFYELFPIIKFYVDEQQRQIKNPGKSN
mgnify:CR=1 FL=1